MNTKKKQHPKPKQKLPRAISYSEEMGYESSPFERMTKKELIDIVETARNRCHEIGVDRDTWRSKFEIGELKIKSMHERAHSKLLDHYNEKERLIDILRGCKNQIEALRKRNDILEAKVSVIDVFNRAMNGERYSCGAEQPDITYYLSDLIAAHERGKCQSENACAQEAYKDCGEVANCDSPQ